MICPDAVEGKMSCTLSYAITGTGLMVCYSHFPCIGWMVCQAEFLHAGQVAMYTPTILHISRMGKIYIIYCT